MYVYIHRHTDSRTWDFITHTHTVAVFLEKMLSECWTYQKYKKEKETVTIATG